MTLTEHAVDQGTPEWRALRLGRLTGSAASAVISLADLYQEKGRENTTSRENLRMQLVAERITGCTDLTSFGGTEAMVFGTNTEPALLAAYHEATGVAPERVGFVSADDDYGLSPDAVVARHADGQVRVWLEGKCPNTVTHLKYWDAQAVPRDYIRQVLHGFLVFEAAEACHFVSYDPRLPGRLALCVVEVPRSAVAALLPRYTEAAHAFMASVREDVARRQAQA